MPPPPSFGNAAGGSSVPLRGEGPGGSEESDGAEGASQNAGHWGH